MRLNEGDRVIRINSNNGDLPVGAHGTVRVYDSAEEIALVDWDDFKHEGNTRHDLDNLELLKREITPAEVQRQIDKALYTKPTNPKDLAATHRLDLTVFPETATIFGAVAMTEGDCKYGGYNYRSAGVGVNTYVAALKRHIGKYYDRGEWADSKTGVPHLANALACIAVLIDGHCKGNITDDRPPRMEADLYTWAEALTKSLHEMFPTGVDRFTETKDGNTDGRVPDWIAPKP